MGKLKLKERKGIATLKNKLKKYEWLSPEEWKILVNQTVPGLLPVQVAQGRRKTVLSVAVSGLIPLSAYYTQPMNMPTILAFLWETSKIAMECERHGLRIESLCWNPDYIFVDQRRGNVYMVYWPAVGLQQTTAEALQFYGNYLQIMKNHGMLRRIYEMYKAYFYQRSVFDLQEFYQLMRQIMGYWKDYCRRQRQREEQGQDVIEPAKAPGTGDLYSSWLEMEGGEGKLYLQNAKTIFGRDKSQSNVVISGDESLSRRHAMIESLDDQFFIVDLGSRNGTFVDDERLPPNDARQILDGTRVRFGNSSFVFHMKQVNRTIHIHQVRRKKG